MSSRAVLAAMTIAVAAAAIAGFAIIGSPATQRELRMDERRVEDLSNLHLLISNHRDFHGRLPASLDELGQSGRARDPLTSLPYEYATLGDDRFELCATFQRSSDDRPGSWRHGAGRQCFDRKAGQQVIR